MCGWGQRTIHGGGSRKGNWERNDRVGVRISFCLLISILFKTDTGGGVYTLTTYPRYIWRAGGEGASKTTDRVGGKFVPCMQSGRRRAAANGLRLWYGLRRY